MSKSACNVVNVTLVNPQIRQLTSQLPPCRRFAATPLLLPLKMKIWSPDLGEVAKPVGSLYWASLHETPTLQSSTDARRTGQLARVRQPELRTVGSVDAHLFSYQRIFRVHREHHEPVII